jgi:hypothetical protein
MKIVSSPFCVNVAASRRVNGNTQQTVPPPNYAGYAIDPLKDISLSAQTTAAEQSAIVQSLAGLSLGPSVSGISTSLAGLSVTDGPELYDCCETFLTHLSCVLY